ncbi:MAG: YtxH domain-containing protein [Anaerolineaceae bacterium]|nr:YtxH domain-containing protein [Anaerolineaceae bacterium]
MQEKRVIIKRSGIGTMIAGFLIGGLIGATVALLSAPQSGYETRSMLGNKAAEIKNRATERASELKDRASDKAIELKGRASDMTSSITNRMNSLTSTVHD